MNYSPALMDKAKQTELVLVGQKVSRNGSRESQGSSELRNIDSKQLGKIKVANKRNILTKTKIVKSHYLMM